MNKEKWRLILSWILDFSRWYIIIYFAVILTFLVIFPFAWDFLKIFPKWFSKTPLGVVLFIFIPVSLLITFCDRQERNTPKMIGLALIIIYFIAFFMYTGMSKYIYKYRSSAYSNSE